MITAKIKFGILLCLPVRFLIFFTGVFDVTHCVYALCLTCIALFVTNYVCVVSYGVMPNFDAIIRVSNYVLLNPGFQKPT